MPEPTLLVDETDGVMTLTFNRPEARNSLSPESIVRLARAWYEYRDSDDLRCAILTGTGDEDFCAGGDLKLLMPLMTGARQPEDEWDHALLENLQQFSDGILRGFELYKPVIVAVNGRALGGGTEMTNACDLRLAAEHATFGTPEAKVGLIPGGGSLTRLPRQIPYAKAMEILMVGDPFSAKEALDMGLLNYVVPRDELMPKARALAERIAENGPLGGAQDQGRHRALERTAARPGLRRRERGLRHRHAVSGRSRGPPRIPREATTALHRQVARLPSPRTARRPPMAIFEPVESDGTRRKLRLKSPVTLEPIGELECATPEDVRAAVDRARKAQSDWAKRSIDERADVMWRLNEQFVKRQDEIIDAVIEETGKTRSDAISMEVFSSCDAITYYTKHAKKFLAPEKRRVHGILGFAKRLKLVYRPLGVVGLITPWNGPIILALNPMVQALLAGQRGRAQAVRGDALLGRGAEELHRSGGLPAGPLPGRSGRRPDRRRARGGGRRQDLVHGQRRHRAQGRRGLRAQPDPVHARARWQGRHDRLRGCRHRTRRLGCADRLLHEHGALLLPAPSASTSQRRSTSLSWSRWSRARRSCGRATPASPTSAPSSGTSSSTSCRPTWRTPPPRARRVLVGGGRNPDLEGLYFEPTVVTDRDPRDGPDAQGNVRPDRRDHEGARRRKRHSRSRTTRSTA